MDYPKAMEQKYTIQVKGIVQGDKRRKMEIQQNAVAQHIYQFTNELLEAVFDANWTIRHGALACLGHIFANTQFQQPVNNAWMSELCIRCLCVIALDRYADYSGAETMAPNLKAAAQVLIQLFPLLLNDAKASVIVWLNYLVSSHDVAWNAALGGLIFLNDYVSQDCSGVASLMVQENFNSLRDLVSSRIEEIQICAIRLLAKVHNVLSNESAMQCLWKVLKTENGVESVICSVFDVVLELISTQTGATLSFLNWDYIQELIRCVKTKSESASIKSIMLIVELFCLGIKWNDEESTTVLHLVVDQLFYYQDAANHQKLNTSLRKLVKRIPIIVISNELQNYAASRLQNLVTTHAHANDLHVPGTIETSFFTNLQIMVQQLPNFSPAMDNVKALVLTLHRENERKNNAHISQIIGNVAAILYPDNELYTNVLYTALYDRKPTDSSILFSEQKILVSQYDTAYRRLFSLFENSTKIFSLKNLSCAKIAKCNEQIFQLPYKTLSGRLFEEANALRCRLFELSEKIDTTFHQWSVRVQATLAASLVSAKNPLPAKVNPLLQALIKSIKVEGNEVLKERSANMLARIVKLQVADNRKIGGATKMVKNMAKLLLPIEDGEVDAQYGTKMFFYALLRAFDEEKLLTKIPGLADILCLNSSSDQADARLAFHLLNTTCELFDATSIEQLVEHLPHYILLSKKKFSRSIGLDAVAKVCKRDVHSAMKIMYIHVFSSFDQTDNLEDVEIGLQLIKRLALVLQGCIQPYIPGFVFFAMKFMNSASRAVREIAAAAFSHLVPLVSLFDPNILPQGLCKEAVIKNNLAYQFMIQLKNGTAIEVCNMSLFGLKRAILRPYQQEGINWLVFLAKHGLNGILADDMGLGKTLQALSAVAATVKTSGTCHPSIIICPATLVKHWIYEAGHFFPADLHPISYEEFNACSMKRNGIVPLLVISYSKFYSNATNIIKRQWHYCILDEGHVIRNPKSKISLKLRENIQAAHRIILTGTPIQNNVQDLWCLFDFLMPGFLYSHEEFRNKFEKQISKSPKELKFTTDGSGGSKAMQKLHERILPFILRRTKAQVLKELPDKLIQDIVCEMSPIQSSLYNILLENDEDDKTSSFSKLMLFRKLCVHPVLVCPNNAIPSTYGLATPPDFRDKQHSGKMLALHELLLNLGLSDDNKPTLIPEICSPHRCLIFAQLKSTLSLVEEFITKDLPSISYLRLDGTVPASKRHPISQKFNSDPSIDVLLLTTSVGGLGLNLTGADIVIFLEHSWNPYEDLQAMDRAHRVGQTRKVQVFRLVSANGIDESIVNVQAFKTNVANAVVSEVTDPTKQLPTDQVLNLIQQSASSNEKSIQEISKTPAIHLGLPKQFQNLDELWDDTQYDSLTIPTLPRATNST